MKLEIKARVNNTVIDYVRNSGFTHSDGNHEEILEGEAGVRGGYHQVTWLTHCVCKVLEKPRVCGSK